MPLLIATGNTGGRRGDREKATGLTTETTEENRTYNYLNMKWKERVKSEFVDIVTYRRFA
jgi:hypothetical protein